MQCRRDKDNIGMEAAFFVVKMTYNPPSNLRFTALGAIIPLIVGYIVALILGTPAA